MELDRFPRLSLAHLPTPIEPLPRLSARLGGPQVFVKRDDATGLALGGNKVRKLEYLLADAIEQGATTVITSGGVQSNHARQTAAAAARLGLACELVLPEIVDIPSHEYRHGGNVLIDRLCGAKVHVVPDGAAAQQRIADIERRVRNDGRAPYTIPVGGSNALGALGYAAAAVELLRQCESGDQSPRQSFDALVVANGSAGTHAGLLAGLLAGLAEGQALPRVYGISVAASAEIQVPKTVRLAEETLSLVGIAGVDVVRHVTVLDDYIGPGYGQPTAEAYEAIELAARLEGLLLDPVYTGKAMAGLVDLVRRGEFRPDQRVLFWHTGGAPGLFAYESWLSRRLDESAG